MDSLADTNIMTSNLGKVVEHLRCVPVLEGQVTPQALPCLICLAIAFLLNMIQIPHTRDCWGIVNLNSRSHSAGRACSGGSDATHDDESRYWRFWRQDERGRSLWSQIKNWERHPRKGKEEKLPDETEKSGNKSGQIFLKQDKTLLLKIRITWIHEGDSMSPQKMMLLHETQMTPSTQSIQCAWRKQWKGWERSRFNKFWLTS